MADSSNTQDLSKSQASLDAEFRKRLSHVGCTAAILHSVAHGLDPIQQAAVKALAHDIWRGVEGVERLQNAVQHFAESEKTTAPASPADLANLNMTELLVLFDYCDRVKDLSTEFINQPRTTGPASDVIEAISRPSLTMQREIVTEVQGRRCTDDRDVRCRAQILVRWAVMMQEHEQAIADAAKAISSERLSTVQ